MAAAGVLALLALAPGASVAVADGCPSTDESYTGTCGPEFEVPSWTDAGGWNDPSQYSTIQLADVNGDGKDELLGRSDAGIEIYWFDMNLGQWRPQVDANGVPQLLKDFASFLPGHASDPGNPNQPQFYSTIQTAHIDGNRSEQVVANFPDGARVYTYSPGPGGSVNGGSWSLESSQSSVLPANADPSRYLSLHAIDGVNGNYPTLTDQASYWRYRLYQFTARAGHGTNAPSSSLPEYYLDNMSAVMPLPFGGLAPANVFRTPNGVGVQSFKSGNDWLPLAPDPTSGFACQASKTCSPFTDTASPSCPAGSTTCFGSSPAYYETMRVANHLEGPNDQNGYVLGRLHDGLHVYALTQVGFDTPGWDASIPVLKDLADPAGGLPAAGEWSSITTGDINGDGTTEVLALDGTGLQAWDYNAGAHAWTKLQPTTPLALGGGPWTKDPEYYSTIRVGDVDGDGHDDVVARGPYGIRTWFYNRRGTGGWERYEPDGYAAFSSQGAQNEQNAYTALNKLATPGLISSGTLRDLWAGENAPQPGDVSNVTNRLPGIAGCDTATGSPPQVTSCTPPAGSTGFTPAQWTAVVNEMLTESDAAGQVLEFFTDLQSLRDGLFLQENAELPAIGSDLGLQAAAGTTAQFNPLSLMSGSLGIAASVAGLAPGIGSALSAALWVVSEITAMIPQTSPTATSSAFPSTYSGLQTKFATMVSETEKGLKVMSQEVRQDASLLGLVSRLRRTGPWATNNLDMIGLQSAANQAFAIWVYQTLVPTVYDRYDITQCAVYGNALCYGPAAGTLGVVGGDPSPNEEKTEFNFIALGPPRDLNGGVPCKNDEQDEVPDCTFTQPPPAFMTSVWGTPSALCSYVPGKSATAWTFGDCNAGADPQASIGQNTWNFTTYSGAFDVSTSHCGWPFGGCWHSAVLPPAQSRSAARTAQVPAGRGPIQLGRPAVGRRRAVHGLAAIQADVTLPRGMRLAGARVGLNRLLFEPGFRELTAPRTRRGEQRLTLRLSRVGPGRFVGTRGGRRWVQVAVRRRGVRASLTVTTARVYHTPRACHALPAAVALRTQPLWLQTRLMISDGRHRSDLEVHHNVRCRRDARGNVDRLEYVPNRRHRLRPGLALTLRGPRSVTPGTTVRYVARVHNRRRGRDRLVSSLWDVTVVQGAHAKHIHELRRGRARSLSLAVRVPSSAGTAGAPRGRGSVRMPGAARGRFCVGVAASAPGARADSAHVCSHLRATLRSTFTG